MDGGRDPSRAPPAPPAAPLRKGGGACGPAVAFGGARTACGQALLPASPYKEGNGVRSPRLAFGPLRRLARELHQGLEHGAALARAGG